MVMAACLKEAVWSSGVMLSCPQGNGSAYVEHTSSSVRNGALVEAKADE